MSRLGHDNAAREAAATGKLWAASLREVEAALATAEGSAARLSDRHAKAIAGVIRETLRAVGLEVAPVGPLLRELLTRAAEGRELLGEELVGVEAARGEVWGELRSALRVEVEGEVRGELEAELRQAADAVRAHEAIAAPVEAPAELVEDEDAEGEDEPVEAAPVPVEAVLDPAPARGGRTAPNRMGIGRASERLSLAERLAAGGV